MVQWCTNIQHLVKVGGHHLEGEKKEKTVKKSALSQIFISLLFWEFSKLEKFKDT